MNIFQFLGYGILAIIALYLAYIIFLSLVSLLWFLIKVVILAALLITIVWFLSKQGFFKFWQSWVSVSTALLENFMNHLHWETPFRSSAVKVFSLAVWLTLDDFFTTAAPKELYHSFISHSPACLYGGWGFPRLSRLRKPSISVWNY